MKSTRIPLADRFWAKVIRGDGCWEWNASKDAKGYGKIGRGGDAGWQRAHRVSWEIANGPVPEGLYVLHECDNPGCVRPDHLFLGTKGDNFRDCLAKGRRPHGNPKLTEAQVLGIYASPGTHQSIADRFGVNRATVTYIKNRSTWKHLTAG